MTMPGSTSPFGSTADYLVDRRRMRRRVFFWRFVALVVVLAGIVGIGISLGGTRAELLQPHIARIAIRGLITGDAATLKLLRDASASPAAAILLSIDSPGGTTTGAELLYDEIRQAAAKKPVVAVVGTMAASGAYIAALGADQITVHGNSLVGSIGVLVQVPNFAGLLDKIGVKVEVVKSSPLKAAPNGFEPTSQAARDALAALVGDSFDWFKGLVKERRKLSDDELAKVADGRVFTGRQSLPLKLADRIGGEREAIAWLEEQRGIAKNLPVRDWKPPGTLQAWGLFSLAGTALRGLGFADAADTLGQASMALDAGSLAGLVSVWRGPSGF